jgi:hypothetical protein
MERREGLVSVPRMHINILLINAIPGNANRGIERRYVTLYDEDVDFRQGK